MPKTQNKDMLPWAEALNEVKGQAKGLRRFAAGFSPVLASGASVAAQDTAQNDMWTRC